MVTNTFPHGELPAWAFRVGRMAGRAELEGSTKPRQQGVIVSPWLPPLPGQCPLCLPARRAARGGSPWGARGRQLLPGAWPQQTWWLTCLLPACPQENLCPPVPVSATALQVTREVRVGAGAQGSAPPHGGAKRSVPWDSSCLPRIPWLSRPHPSCAVRNCNSQRTPKSSS